MSVWMWIWRFWHTSATEYHRNLAVPTWRRGAMEVDISSGFENLNLNAALQRNKYRDSGWRSYSRDEGCHGVAAWVRDCFLYTRKWGGFQHRWVFGQHCLYQFTGNENFGMLTKLLWSVHAARQYSGPKAMKVLFRCASQKVKLMFSGNSWHCIHWTVLLMCQDLDGVTKSFPV